MSEGAGETVDRFVEPGGLRVELRIQTLLPGPLGVAPHGRIDGQAAKRGRADPSLNGGTDDKRADPDGQFAELYIGAVDCDGVIGRGRDADATANAFALDAGDDELGAFAQGIDEVGKAAEEDKALVGILDGHQFVEGGAGAKYFCAGGTQDNDPGLRVIAGAVDLLGKGIEQPSRQGVALGMIKFNGGDPVMCL